MMNDTSVRMCSRYSNENCCHLAYGNNSIVQTGNVGSIPKQNGLQLIVTTRFVLSVYIKRRTRDSNPQPVARHLISNQAASHSRILRMAMNIDDH